jgi:hypothetical protein
MNRKVKSRAGTRSSRVGITLAPSGLRWALVTPARGRLRLTSRGWIPRRAEATDADLVATLRTTIGSGPRRVRLLDEVHPPILRIANLPPMPEPERRLAIVHDVQAEEEILGESVVHGEAPLPPEDGQSRTLLAILPKRRLEEIHGALEGSAFVLDGICAGPLLLLDLLEEMAMMEPAEAVAIIAVGSSRIHVAMVNQGRLTALRQVHQGLDSTFLTGTDGAVGVVPASRQEIDLELAEELDRGLLDLVEVVAQIRRTFSAAYGRGEHLPVQRIWLAGEAARARSLAPLLQNDLRVPVSVLDPRSWKRWEGAIDLNDEEAPSYALTLALAGLELERLRVTVGRRRREIPARAILAGVGGAALLLNLALLASTAVMERQKAFESSVQAHHAEQQATAPVLSREMLNQWVTQQQAPLRESPDVRPLLDAVARAMPEDAWLQNFSVVLDGAVWRAKAQGAVEGPNPWTRQAILSDLVGALRHSGAFASTRLGPLGSAFGPGIGEKPLPFMLVLSNGPLDASAAEGDAPERRSGR